MKTFREIVDEIDGRAKAEWPSPLAHEVLRKMMQAIADEMDRRYPPCVYEVRADVNYGGMVAGTPLAWCRTHGFHCPTVGHSASPSMGAADRSGPIEGALLGTLTVCQPSSGLPHGYTAYEVEQST